MVKHAQRFKGQLRSVNANTELKLRKITVNESTQYTCTCKSAPDI